MNHPKNEPHILGFTPTVNGKALGDSKDDSQFEVKQAFVDAYRQINIANRERLQRSQEKTKESQDRLRESLELIEEKLLAKEALERKYEPLGMIPTPELKDGYIVDLWFGNSRSSEQTGFVASGIFSV